MTLNKTTKALSFATVMIAMTGMMGISFDQAFAEPGKGGASDGPKGVGKGGFQLNLIGQDRDSEADCTNKGHRIHVPLTGPYKIKLTEGDFRVTDCNALDSKHEAGFRLPDPTDLDGDGETDPGLGCDDAFAGTTCILGYQVWIRVLGQPGKTVSIGPTCATEAVDFDGDGIFNEYVCTTDDVLEVPSANGPGKKSKFKEVSKELLTICVDLDGDGDCDQRIALFDDGFIDFLWNFDSDGARNTQLRFIIAETTVG